MLERYDVAIIISSPGLDLEDLEATDTVSMVIREGLREKLLEQKIPLDGLIEEFEKVFD